MKKYESIERYGKNQTKEVLHKGSNIVVMEKLDGANASFTIDENDYKKKAFSRNNELSEENDLRGFYQFVMEKYIGIWFPTNYIVYGEWLVKHSIKYPDESYNTFYLFDVYDKELEQYLGIDTVKHVAEMLGLELAPILYEGEFQSIDHLQSFIGKSKIGDVGEGIVVKNYDYRDKYGKQLFVKFVSDEFSEVSRTKKHNVKSGDHPLQEFIKQTTTKARVKKNIHKMVDEGLLEEDYDLTDMGKILKDTNQRVYEDIIDEEMEMLLKLVRKQLSKELPNVVKEIIREKESITEDVSTY